MATKKPIKLMNRYHKDIVYCRDINDVTEGGGYRFIRVYREELPSRTFLVNIDAYIEVK